MRILEKLTKERVEENSETLELTGGEFLYYDFSKSHIAENDKEEIRSKILSNGFESKIEGMLQGRNINTTESRPVLHYLLRDERVLLQVEQILGNEESAKKAKTSGDVISNAKEEIIEELARIARFSEAFDGMEGVTSKTFDTIVNIGIGGSDLGTQDGNRCFAGLFQGQKGVFHFKH
ncbi:uncharacterized protein VICG_01620 [Vittaforma corneae ATCC 50505]|uniref:Glucose-6-phosphate isomerase n=1 Tax=Vittaforma corneae (strain ATCC 50505) TaxID=993615 RepID=L2GL59_VITCO|nr:uncharacterized protein VICG_01620 [Vittaforma corneae ATCC 50505]ELA41379.1 hypothetical protein VICG_01620 [Vittaforma corneae ATCC 50505]